MCYVGVKPSIKKEKAKGSIKIKKSDIIIIKHPDEVDDGVW